MGKIKLIKQKRMALFYPWIKSKGGAERVILEILKSKKYNIDIYTWVYDEENSFEEFKKFKINVIAPGIARNLSRFNILRGLFFPVSLFSKIPLEKYDLFLIYTSGMAELITFRNYKPGKTYAYVNTPLRHACEEIVEWNLKNIYKNPFSKSIYLLSAKFYRMLEKIAWKRIDKAIFISDLGLERAEKHNLIKGENPEVIYPPINLKRFDKIKSKKQDYFLYVSRFNAPKRQDLLIKAWDIFSKNNPNEKLILAGHIENKKYFKKIKKLAKESRNVIIKSDLSEEENLEMYANCKAVVSVPFMEDFGIVVFEALAAGKPIIAVDKGGYVKLVDGTSQFYKIKEVPSEEEMIKEINKSLEKFLKSKNIPKKILFNDLSTINFINKFEKVLE
ncbi:glycosyltransferase [Candidatus Pacearchaeota archaeon]|nr:glycosyltransferase [Candidatus Pacearchaeota archaeon]